MNRKPLIPLLATALLLISGCAPFTAEPSSFIFEGMSWKVSSVELVDELSFPAIKPRSPSEVLLVVQFGIEDQSVSDPSQKEALREAFGQIILESTGRTPDQAYTHSEEQGGPIDYVECVFSVPNETTSVELVLPDSRVIKITM